jgi:hypothetical protein
LPGAELSRELVDDAIDRARLRSALELPDGGRVSDEVIDELLQGWIGYYGRFYKSARLARVLRDRFRNGDAGDAQNRRPYPASATRSCCATGNANERSHANSSR